MAQPPGFGDEDDRAEPPHDAGAPSGALVARLIEQFDAAWECGERPRAEAFLERHPELPDEAAMQVVYEEACLRLDQGEESLSAEFFARFPAWRSRLAVLIECKRLLNAAPAADFPEAGDELADFALVAELGRGAAGRTFLARQRSLADRPMVLKLLPVEHEEHLSLARLQHMNVVPLYFEQVLGDRNVRVLGMPYLGGTSLARLLRTVQQVPLTERMGTHLLDALDACSAGVPAERPAHGPIRRYLARASFVQAICWIGASLADGLHYAHECGLVHFDLKPSNVLIAEDGQPMLLDFHLAREPIAPGSAPPERLGGTPGYWSPEQKRAMDAIAQGRPLDVGVDGRSDIYSLGVLLYEALGGDPGDDRADARPLERCNPRVSPGLSDIVRKCVAADPADRYADGASVALDLRRHLNDLPLHGVANRSLVERWQRWRRRSSWASARGILRAATLVAILTCAVLLAVLVYQRDRAIDATIAEGLNHFRRGRYAEAGQAWTQGLALAAQNPWHDRRRNVLEAHLRRVSWAEAVAGLHETVDALRFRFGVTPPDPAEARALYQRAAPVWSAREQLANPPFPAPDPRTLEQVRTDLKDLATILADLRTRSNPTDDPRGGYQAAVTILRESEARFGPGAALRRDLRQYEQALGIARDNVGPLPEPTTAWDHYDLGRSYLRSGDYAAASRAFQRAIELRPDEFWPHYFHGVCGYRLGRFADAAASLSTAIALAPRTPESYYNRALVYQALGQIDEAIRDNTRALELQPQFADAALNRGILRFRAGKHSAALVDFAQARQFATNPGMLGLIRYNEALVHLAERDTTAAEACLDEAIVQGDQNARRLRERLHAR